MDKTATGPNSLFSSTSASSDISLSLPRGFPWYSFSRTHVLCFCFVFVWAWNRNRSIYRPALRGGVILRSGRTGGSWSAGRTPNAPTSCIFGGYASVGWVAGSLARPAFAMPNRCCSDGPVKYDLLRPKSRTTGWVGSEVGETFKTSLRLIPSSGREHRVSCLHLRVGVVGC